MILRSVFLTMQQRILDELVMIREHRFEEAAEDHGKC